MIYLRLCGGLGNQLYQLAAAALLSNNQRQMVVPYVDGMKDYEIPRNPDSLALLAPNDWLCLNDMRRRNLVRWLSITARAGKMLPLLGVNDRNFWRIQERNWILKQLFQDGYFQHGWKPDTFAKALTVLPVLPIAAAAANRIEDGEVVIHIRGGDFLQLPKYQVVDAAFYIATTRAAIAQGHRRFAVMSDDHIYAKTICYAIRTAAPNVDLRMLQPGASTLEDFDTLRAASARIIGNSTFAWWATALDNKASPTWSTTKFTVDEARDFFLPYEIPIQGY